MFYVHLLITNNIFLLFKSAAGFCLLHQLFFLFIAATNDLISSFLPLATVDGCEAVYTFCITRAADFSNPAEQAGACDKFEVYLSVFH